MYQSLSVLLRCESVCRVEPEERIVKGRVEVSKICCLSELLAQINACKITQTAVKISQKIFVQDLEIRCVRRNGQNV